MHVLSAVNMIYCHNAYGVMAVYQPSLGWISNSLDFVNDPVHLFLARWKVSLIKLIKSA